MKVIRLRPQPQPNNAGGGEQSSSTLPRHGIDAVEAYNLKVLRDADRLYGNQTIKLTTSPPFEWTESLSQAWIQVLENRHKRNSSHLKVQLRLNGMTLNMNMERWFHRAVDWNLIEFIQTNELDHLALIAKAVSNCQSLKRLVLKWCIYNDNVYKNNNNNSDKVFFHPHQQQAIREFSQALGAASCQLEKLELDLTCFGLDHQVQTYLAKPIAQGLRINQSLDKFTLHGGWDKDSMACFLLAFVTPCDKDVEGDTGAVKEPKQLTKNKKDFCLEFHGVTFETIHKHTSASRRLYKTWAQLWENNTQVTELQFTSCTFENSHISIPQWFGRRSSNKLQTNDAQQPLQQQQQIRDYKNQSNILECLRLVDMELTEKEMEQFFAVHTQKPPGLVVTSNLQTLDVSKNRISSLQCLETLQSSSSSTTTLPNLHTLLLHDNPFWSTTMTTTMDNYQHLHKLLRAQPSVQQVLPEYDNYKMTPIYCQHGPHRGTLDYTTKLQCPTLWSFYLAQANHLFRNSGSAQRHNNESSSQQQQQRREAAEQAASAIFTMLQIATECGVSFRETTMEASFTSTAMGSSGRSSSPGSKRTSWFGWLTRGRS